MFAPYEWMLAFRYLRARRKESFISVISIFSLIGITLGVATLIIVMAVMNGFRIELLDRILGVNGHIMVHSAQEAGFTAYEATADRIRAVPGVTRVAPMVEGQVMASADTGSLGVLVRGFSDGDLKNLETVSGNLVDGSLDNFEQERGVAIGSGLAQQLGLWVGSSITLVAPRGAVTPFGVTPRIKSYPVVAIFEVGMSQYDSGIVFMPLNEAQLYFNKPEAVTSFEIMVDDPDQAEPIAAEIQSQIYQPGYTNPWQLMNKAFFSALQVERNVMFLILSLIILVAALNIISGLIMLVKDKGQDIAILRSMGATQGSIMRVFFITGSSIGVVGTLIGVAIGVLFCLNIDAIQRTLSSWLGFSLWDPAIRFLTEMPADMQNDEVISVVIMSLTLSFLATLYPSWRAARMDPLEALRYE